MKKYSEDNFVLRSRLTPNEIIDRLSHRTLERKSLAMVLTDKDFIGRIEETNFSIIDSSFPLPYGAMCILNGKISSASQICLTTTLHKAFRILFLVWIIAMVLLALTFWILNPARIDGLLAAIIGMLIIALIFRLFLHVMYVFARNIGLKKMKSILDVVD